uniref:Ribosomal protein L7/L12 C-terminal domain-containing protein n=1 Tax=Ditylenchus dipsaci TaxID=166011 RepID=A0A915DE64_9BILA
MDSPSRILSTARMLWSSELFGSKIGCGNYCIACSSNAKRFRDTERENIVEYIDYYDYSSLLNGDGDLPETDDALIDEGAFLVLPSGAKVGHRTLMRYFKQSLKPERASFVEKYKQNKACLLAVSNHLVGQEFQASLPSYRQRGSEKHISRVESIVEQIVSLPLLEVSDLNCALKRELNIPDAPTAAAATEEVAPETAAPQKISFAVKLTKFDATKKIALIKQIRDLIPGLNLVQAKKIVESAPVEVKADLGQNEADELKATLEKVGGEAEIV